MAGRKKKAKRARHKPDPSESGQERKKGRWGWWAARSALSFGVFVAFGRSLTHPLLSGWDDDRMLADNPLVRETSLHNFWEIIRQPHFQAYHPLHLLSYWLDVPWLGFDAVHGFSLVLWIAAGWAVMEIARALGWSPLAGVAAALLVILHPVQTEAVVWASGRKDVLALLLGALAVVAHLRSQRWNDGRAWLSRIAFLSACFAKTSALPLPLVLFSLDVLVRGRSWREALRAQWISIIAALLLGAAVIFLWSENEMIRTTGGFLERPALVGATMSHYLKTIAWPAALSPVYPIHRDALPLSSPAVWVGTTLFIALGLVAYRLKQRWLGFALAGFFLFWLPVSNLVPLYFQWQDRYISLALLPPSLALGAAVEFGYRAARSSAQRIRAQYVLASVVVLVSAILSLRAAQYAGQWRNATTLFGHAASVHPDSYYAWLGLGHARRVDAGDLRGAVGAYSRAVGLANLPAAHIARFDALIALERQERTVQGSDAEGGGFRDRFASALSDPVSLRELAADLLARGYRAPAFLVLDYVFTLRPANDDQLERAAAIRIERREFYLADYYISRMSRQPLLPVVEHYVRTRDGDSQTP